MVLHSIRLAVLITLCTFNSLQANSDTEQWFKKSTITLTDLSEVPGMVLEPGSYIVKLKESGEKRSVVEIRNSDETKVLATIVAVPDHRMRPDDNTDFTYHKVKSNGPSPIQSWFFAGDLVGLEFVYPKARALQIAKESNDYVMASNNIKDAAIVAVTPNGKEVVIDDPVAQTARRKPQ